MCETRNSGEFNEDFSTAYSLSLLICCMRARLLEKLFWICSVFRYFEFAHCESFILKKIIFTVVMPSLIQSGRGNHFNVWCAHKGETGTDELS